MTILVLEVQEVKTEYLFYNLSVEILLTFHYFFLKYFILIIYFDFHFIGDTSIDAVEEDVALKSLFHSQNVKLSSFMQNSCKVFLFHKFLLNI